MLSAQCSLQLADLGAGILPSQKLAALLTEHLRTGRRLRLDRKGAADCVLWKGKNPPAHCSAYAERSPITTKKPLLRSFGDQL